MDIQKEREAFDAYFKGKYPELHKDVFKEDGDDRAIIGYSFAWSSWQAAKAQAVPEGFVVASTKDLNIIYDQINDWNTDWPLVFGLFNRILEAQEPAND